MGFKKFGTGPIIDVETTSEATKIQTTAGQAWTTEDEQALQEEGGE